MASTKNKKQVVIGKEEYINQKTGELEIFNVVSQYDQDFNFNKLWLGHILESLDIIGNKKIKVLNWLLANKDSKNQVIGTQKRIANEIGISYPIVNETINMLAESKLLKKVQNGVYLLNPDVIFKGTNNRRMAVLLRYNTVDTYNQEAKDVKEPPKQAIDKPKANDQWDNRRNDRKGAE